MPVVCVILCLKCRGLVMEFWIVEYVDATYVLCFSVYLNVKMSLEVPSTKHVDVSTFCALVVVLAWNLVSISLLRSPVCFHRHQDLSIYFLFLVASLQAWACFCYLGHHRRQETVFTSFVLAYWVS